MAETTNLAVAETISAFNMPLDHPAVSRWWMPIGNKASAAEVEEAMR
jgi:hypothetical protein